jgi:galactokinase
VITEIISLFSPQNNIFCQQKTALQKGDFKGFLKLVNASGQSSFDYLQNLYSLSDVSMQGIPLGIAFTKDFLKETGACRVHGGGFAGAVQCYVPTDKVEEFKEYSEKFFGKGNCHVLSIRPVGGYEIK